MTEHPDVTEGKMRAAIQRARMGAEVAAKADALVASVPDLLARAFVGPSNKKGRQAFVTCTCGHTTKACPVHGGEV